MRCSFFLGGGGGGGGGAGPEWLCWLLHALLHDTMQLYLLLRHGQELMAVLALHAAIHAAWAEPE